MTAAPLELSQDGLRDLLDAVGEHRVGADLDEGPPRPRRRSRSDRRLEQDRLAQVAEPVLGVQLGGVGGLAGDGRVEGELGRAAAGSPASAASSSLAERLDLRRVGRVVDADAPRPARRRPRSSAAQLGRAPRVAGDDDRRRPVDGGDHGDPLHGSAARSARSARAAPTAIMPPLPGDCARGPGCAGRRPGRVVERQRAGDVGGGDLALGVADDGGRLARRRSATAGRERDHHREQRGLDDVDALQRRARRVAAQDVRSSDQSTCGASAAAQAAHPLGEDRGARRAARRAIPGHWAPWPGKTNTGAPPPAPSTTPSTRRGDGLPSARLARPSRSSSRLSADDDRPLIQSGARGSERPADVLGAKRRARRGGRSARVAPSRSAGRSSPRGRRAPGPSRRPTGSASQAALGRGAAGPGAASSTDVAVRAAHAEGADAGDPRRPASGHGSAAVWTRRPSSSSGIAGFGVLEVQARRELAVTEGQHRLDQPGDAGRGLQMADVGLHRADQQRRAAGRARRRARRRAPPASTGSPSRRAGAVQLDVLDLGRRRPRRARRPAAARRCCASGSGAVSPSPPPSLLTALPRITP